MNDTKRKAVREIIEQLEALQGRIEDLLDEEEEFRDSMPEDLQGSERYDKADSACDLLDEAFSDLEGVISTLEDVIE